MNKEINIDTPLGKVQINTESNSDFLLATSELPHTMSNGMTIDRSTACVLKVMPGKEHTNFSFSGSLIDSGLIGEAAAGQYLDCIEWKNEDWHLTLGTEDSEALGYRLPCINIATVPYTIEYSNSRLILNFKNLKHTEAVTFHFIISYKKLPDPRECSAWFFAEIDHYVVTKTLH
jgi:hypothetical protein